MFNDLSGNDKRSLHLVLALCTPAEVNINGRTENLWNNELIVKIARELSLPQSCVDAYLPMVSQSTCVGIDWKDREQMARPCITALTKTENSALKLYTQILIFLVECDKCDGRGRVVLRNLLRFMNIPARDAMWIEFELSLFLIDQQEKISHAKETAKNKYRYVKIGAVAIGAGAVLAVTGGLVSVIYILN